MIAKRLVFLLLFLALPGLTLAQEVPGAPAAEPLPEPGLEVPQQVDVAPVRDEEIAQRLQRILEATGRFEDLQVRVNEGVVFLRGDTRTEDHKQWARQLALRTTDVAAVVNNLNVVQGPLWNFNPSIGILRNLWRTTVQRLPIVAFSLLILLLTATLALGLRKLALWLLARRIETPLLRSVTASILAGLVFIVGVYLVLRIANLTGLAATVLGGTGLIGLIIGIGFRDISENFLASLLLSMQKPFRAGDTVRINEHFGVVQRLTTRGTLLMGFDGNYIQIPNSIVYKNVIVNLTANPKIRLDFVIGIGYDTRISFAQEVALKVLHEHPAVLDDPEPTVLVENLGAATVDLRIFFWIDTREHSWLKMKSPLMRLIVRAYLEAGISLPDAAREVIFPQGVPVFRLSREESPPPPQSMAAPVDTHAQSTQAEGNLQSEVEALQAQVRQSRLPEEGRDML